MDPRLATPEDSAMIWRWRNDPVTRAMSFQTGEIAWATHERWYAESLVATERRRLWIIRDETGQSCGLLRLDREENVAEVSLHVAPECRGRGHGTHALIWLGQQLEHTSLPWSVRYLMARVKSENARAIGIFLKAGFQPIANERFYLAPGIITLARAA